MNMTQMASIPLEYQTGTFGTAAAQNLVDLGFDTENVGDSDIAHITVTGQNARYTYIDGSAPTTSTGHLVLAGSEVVITGRVSIRQIKLIAETGTCGFNITISKL